jgi:hypothetical protein
LHLRHVMGSTIGMLMTLRGRYLPPASCRVSSCLAARCDECDFTKVAPSQVADSQFACSLKLELQVALLRMCQSPPFTYTCNSARSPATEVRTVLCARPRWMHASCQWQRLSKAAAEGRLETLFGNGRETAENVYAPLVPPWYGST